MASGSAPIAAPASSALQIGLQVEAGGAIELPHDVVVGRVAQELGEVLTARPRSVAAGRELDPVPAELDEVEQRERLNRARVLRGLDRRGVVRRRLGNAGRDGHDVEEREDEREACAAFRSRLGGLYRRGQRGSGRGALARVREIDELGSGSRHEELRDRVLRVELVVVEMDRAGDEPARRERAVDDPGSLLGLERAHEPAHRGAEREDALGRVREGCCRHRADRGELVADGGVQRPPGAGGVVRRAGERVAAREKCVARRRVRRVRRQRRPEAMAVEDENAVPARRNVRDPRSSVRERPREVGASTPTPTEPVPATSVRTRTTTRSVLRSQMPRRFTIDLPLLVPASRPLCLRRQMTMGVSNVEGYLSTTLILSQGRGGLRVRGDGAVCSRSGPRSMLRSGSSLWRSSGARGTRPACPRTATPSAQDRGRRRSRGRARGSRAPQPPGDKRLRRSHRYFFFVKAGPKSGLTWQFWILPTHIESSWRPWWFFRER